MAADYCKVSAIVRVESLEPVEKALQDHHVGGVTVSRVKGYGEYADFFARDWMSPYVRVEIFTSAERAPAIAEAVIGAASTGTRGDGILVVQPVDSVLRIRSGSRIPPDEL